MPFTPAHAAAALPLLRTPLPASALVIGTLAPDLPYYTPVGTAWSTHSALSVVTTDLLLGLRGWGVWHAVLAPAALAAAPRAVRARLASAPGGPVVPGLRHRLRAPADGVAVVAAAAVGAATHVAWDELSHPGRWGTERLALLRDAVGPLEAYRWVQHGSGVLGLAELAVWLVLWWRRTVPQVPDGAGRGASSSSPAVGVGRSLLLVAAVAGTTAAASSPDLRTAALLGALARRLRSASRRGS